MGVHHIVGSASSSSVCPTSVRCGVFFISSCSPFVVVVLIPSFSLHQQQPRMVRLELAGVRFWRCRHVRASRLLSAAGNGFGAAAGRSAESGAKHARGHGRECGCVQEESDSSQWSVRVGASRHDGLVEASLGANSSSCFDEETSRATQKRRIRASVLRGFRLWQRRLLHVVVFTCHFVRPGKRLTKSGSLAVLLKRLLV